MGQKTKHVVNAHIWPHHNKANLVLVDLAATDIDSPQNILRLHKDIERYFDHKQLTFIQSGNVFLLKVLDPGIRSEVLKDTDVTFADIDENELVFPNSRTPWRRLLATHSILAHRHARSETWLPEDELTTAESNAQDLMQFSLDSEAQARLRMFLQTSKTAHHQAIC